MKTIFALSILLASFSNPSGQSNDNDGYYDGTIILNNDTISGSIKIDLENNHLLVKQSNRNQLLTAQQIELATINGKSYRGAQYGENYYLFEVIFDAKHSLLYRENVKEHMLDENTMPPFFIQVKNQLKPVQKEKEITELFGNDEKWMLQHIKNEQLDILSKKGAIQAFTYYSAQTH